MQGIWYPCICFLGLRRRDYNLVAWMHTSWSEVKARKKSLSFVRVWLYSFAGYLFKDLFCTDDLLYLLHHIGCLLGIMMALSLPCGTVSMMLLMFLFECGSLFMCLSKIFPPEPHIDIRFDRLYWIMMTVSNLLGVVVMIYFLRYVDSGMFTSTKRWALVVSGTSLVIVMAFMRQKVAMENMDEAEARYAASSALISRYQDGWLIDDGTAKVATYASAIGLTALFLSSLSGPEVPTKRKGM